MSSNALSASPRRLQPLHVWLNWLACTCCLAILGLLTMYLAGYWYVATIVYTSHDEISSTRFFSVLAVAAVALTLGISAGFAAWLLLARFVFGLERERALLYTRGGLPGKIDRWLVSRLYRPILLEA